MNRRFAISDIHGCFKTFKNLLLRLELEKVDEVYLLGDYIDRGPDSCKVIDLILEYQALGFSFTCLRGNHEQLLLKGLDGDPYMMDVWLRNGGLDTLHSYNITVPEKIPEVHLQWIRSTRFFLELPDYWLVHAGFNMEQDPFTEDTEAMLWIRKFIPQLDKLSHKPVIHGHTPIPYSEMLSGLESLSIQGKLSIDNGCVYKSKKEAGALVALDLDARIVHRLPNEE
ncbi:MAG: serine/threonine protein phosphatase [Cytophagaceae bacterium]|jgi:serine/threonine protein phosphatase 1|nr:serine/threonine protein phosphatase [Cytophagaceae bacterium]